MPPPFEKYKGRSVLITGGLGFIGSNLALKLIEAGAEVTIVDALFQDQGGNRFNIEPHQDRVKLHVADIGDSYIINHLVGGMDYIFNLAGNVSHVDSMTTPHHDLQVNCTAHLSLLEACRMFNPHVKVVFTSTRQVYGRSVYLPVDEEHRVQPLDINGIHKLAAENYHLLYHKVYGMRSVCLRLSNIYGPRQQMKHSRQGFIAWFIRQAIDGGVIELFGEGRQRRDLTFVEDAIEAILLAGISEAVEGEIFNVGDDKNVSLAEIAEELIKQTGRGTISGIPFPLERQLIDVGNCSMNYKKIERVLGWQPKKDWKKGLRQTVDFYEQNKKHYWGENAASAVS